MASHLRVVAAQFSREPGYARLSAGSITRPSPIRSRLSSRPPELRECHENPTERNSPSDSHFERTIGGTGSVICERTRRPRGVAFLSPRGDRTPAHDMAGPSSSERGRRGAGHDLPDAARTQSHTILCLARGSIEAIDWRGIPRYHSVLLVLGVTLAQFASSSPDWLLPTAPNR